MAQGTTGTKVTEEGLSFEDVTTANSSTLEHGLLPKLSGSTAEYLSGGGTWRAVTGEQVYPSAGIPNSTGSAWGTSYTTTGTGTVVALQTSPVLSGEPSIGTNNSRIKFTPTSGSDDYSLLLTSSNNFELRAGVGAFFNKTFKFGQLGALNMPFQQASGFNSSTLVFPAAASNINITFPSVASTLATLAGTESLTNKKLGSLTGNGPIYTSGGDGTLNTSALTSGRIPYWNGSALVDDADLTFATDTLTATKYAGGEINLTKSGSAMASPTGGVAVFTNAANATDNAIVAINSGSGAGNPRLGLYGAGTERARIQADLSGNVTIQAQPTGSAVQLQFGPTTDSFSFSDGATNNQLFVNGASSTNGPAGIRVPAGCITVNEIAATPASPTSGTEGRIYIKSDLLVVQWNDGGTVRYKYLTLSGTGTGWTHTTTAP